MYSLVKQPQTLAVKLKQNDYENIRGTEEKQNPFTVK